MKYIKKIKKSATSFRSPHRIYRVKLANLIECWNTTTITYGV